MAIAAAGILALAGCGSDAEQRAGTSPDDSVVLGTDPVPTPTETTPKRDRRSRSRRAFRRTRPTAAPATPAAREPGRVTVIGDSLAVGTQTLLPAALPGWSVTTDARKGRPLAEGMQVLSGADVPAGSVLVFSLFTNDTPTATGALQSALRAGAAKVGPQGCQVWATIARARPRRRRRAGQPDPARPGRRPGVRDAGGGGRLGRDGGPPARAAGPRQGARDAGGLPARAQLYADAVKRC